MVKNIYEKGESLPLYCIDCGASGWKEYLGPFQDLDGAWWHLYKCVICHFEIRQKAVVGEL